MEQLVMRYGNIIRRLFYKAIFPMVISNEIVLSYRDSNIAARRRVMINQLVHRI